MRSRADRFAAALAGLVEEHGSCALAGSDLILTEVVGLVLSRHTTADQAMKSLRPPLFFKAADQFRANLNNWAVNKLQRALQILLEAEKDCKSGLAIPETIAHRAMIKVAVARQKQARR